MSWAPIAAAGIQAGGSLLGGMFGAAGQSASNAQQFANQEMLFDQQQTKDWSMLNANFQQQNTAWRRGVEDMKLAGINPILAANLGGAASGGGSGGSTPAAGMLGNPGAAMGAGIAGAANSAGALLNFKKTVADTENVDADTKVRQATEDLTKKQADKTVQEEKTAKSAESLNNATALTKVSEAAYNAAAANSANSVARVNTRIAEDTERYGDSAISKAVGGLFRMLGVGASNLPNSSTARGIMQTPGLLTAGPRDPISGKPRRP